MISAREALQRKYRMQARGAAIERSWKWFSDEAKDLSDWTVFKKVINQALDAAFQELDREFRS